MRWIRFLCVGCAILAFTLPHVHLHARSYAVPKTVIPWKGEARTHIERYTQLLKAWTETSCPPKVRREFQELYKRYRAAGFYIPVADGEVQTETVRDHLPRIEKKLKWIQSLQKNLRKKDLPRFTRISSPLRQRVNELLDYKKDYQLATSKKKKSKIARRSAKALKSLHKEFMDFTDEIPFLLSFEFPVDHLANRMAYERLKAEGNEKAAAEVFFRRQIYEDGALDPDHSRSDLYLRTTLDTIAQNLNQKVEFLAEEPRFDLEWALGLIEENLGRGKRVQLNRLAEWEARTRNELGFYRELISEDGRGKSEKLLATKAKATAELRDFVYRKHTKTYEFFSQQPELHQALFVFDQILLNEIGLAESSNYRDRRDVSQIIINRRYNTLYSKLAKEESLYTYLRAHTRLTDGDINLAKWLNVMFKEEQFSFTLYFIPAVERVFCPDFYKTARVSRERNLTLALDLLRKPRTDFRALRYFSRFSMVGKVDMGQMWDGYVPLPPEPGRSVRLTARLREALENRLYRYLYNFVGSDGDTYHVLEIGKRSYVVKGLTSQPKLFQYRNPHHFTYFQPK